MIKKWRMIVCNTEILISNCCDFNFANLLVRGNIAVTTNITRSPVIQVAFKNLGNMLLKLIEQQ